MECLDGFDGGQVQNFQLEVYNFETNYLLVNTTSKQPVFKVEGLNPGVNVKINIYAFNSKGKSDIVSLDGFTLKIAEKQTGKIKMIQYRYYLNCFINMKIILIIQRCAHILPHF